MFLFLDIVSVAHAKFGSYLALCVKLSWKSVLVSKDHCGFRRFSSLTLLGFYFCSYYSYHILFRNSYLRLLSLFLASCVGHVFGLDSLHTSFRG